MELTNALFMWKVVILVLMAWLPVCQSVENGRYIRRHANLSFTNDGNIVFIEPDRPLISPVRGIPADLELDPDPEKESDDLDMTDHQYTLGNASTESQTQCFVQTGEPGIDQRIDVLLEENNKLIHYDVSFLNYTFNPLLENVSVVYRGNHWTRVSSLQGQTLLSLAFNYGPLSLMTLSFGVEHMNIRLKDEPAGCFRDLTEQEKMAIIMELMMRDFKDQDVLALNEEESICHQILQSSNGYAFFTHHCCKAERDGVTISCMVNQKNIWIRILDIMLIISKFLVLFSAPLLAPSGFFTKTLDAIRFVVKLKEPMLRTLCVVRGLDKVKAKSKNTINLCETKHFDKCRQIISELPHDVVIPIKIHRFEIAVDYSKLLVENKVPVGFLRTIANAIFSCGLKEIAPFTKCCQTNMFSYLKELQPVPWIIFWTAIGKLLLVLLVPSIFYIRLAFFYNFEHPEIIYRADIAEKNNLTLAPHEFKMMQYLLPTHPICISIYCIYGITVVVLAYVGLTGDMTRFQRIIYTSFNDLNRLSWLKAGELICSKVIWPFSKFGVCGCLVAPLFWLFILPLILIVYMLYCLPLVFLTYRMILYSVRILHKAKIRHDVAQRKHLKLPSPVSKSIQKGAKTFQEEFLLHELLPEHDDLPLDRDRPATSSLRRVSIRCLAVFLLVLSVYGVSVLGMECVGFVVELLMFTLMGIIVNASSVLKYLTLGLLVVMYSYDCYNNVYKKYVKLNKALFTDVKGRMTKQVEEVTSLPAHLQENTGFKACENSEQADYESPDDMSSDLPMHWDLNDVILFIDNRDMPRIPQTLFEQVCEIQVAGSPGPVYRSMIEATKKFMFIIFFLIFVFIVVLSFGSIYKVSSANQTLAALAGGFVPFIMRNFMQPSTPELEIGTVSFRSKLDEIIQNFSQQWPMYDFPFEVNIGGESESTQGDNMCDKSTQTSSSSSVSSQTEPDQGVIQTPDIMTSTGLNFPVNNPFMASLMSSDGGAFSDNSKSDETQEKGVFLAQTDTLQGSLTEEGVGLDSAVPPPVAAIFELAADQEVDIVVVLPEAGETTWCRVWSRISLYERDALGEQATETEVTETEDVTQELV